MADTDTTGKDHSFTVRHLTDSIQLRSSEKKLHVNFKATVLVRVPHPVWTEATAVAGEEGAGKLSKKKLWRSLAVESSQNILLDVKLLWKQNTLPEEWSHLSESLGQALSRSPLWQQLGLSTSLEIPSHGTIHITLTSSHYTALPSTLHLPTSSVQSIQWCFNFTPYCTRPKSAGLQLDHILPLFDECVDSFLNNKVGAQIRSSMAAVESITSTLARYASQCDDYTSFKSRIRHIKDKIESASPIAEQAMDLQKALRCQIYHQVLKALQGTRLRKKIRYRSSSRAENELLSQPLERFQDLFDGTRNMLSQDDNDDDDEGRKFDGEGMQDNEGERSEFEDLFEEEDNYSDFEDLLEETNAIRQEINNDMVPDSPTPAPTPQIQPTGTQNECDMASECSDFGFTMLEDSYITAPSQQYHTPQLGLQLTNNNNDEEYDHFTDIEAPPTPILFSSSSSIPIENDPPPPIINPQHIQQPFWENEESLMMFVLFKRSPTYLNHLV
ncbi:hypothetical protein TWF730_003479 [Orbilia blumenaviensis]|uniref:Uncharacterized protein n=1 Tax=Orbilia blumenaviensis TaxID=1796055 RepID=A0AAV9U343_9PEZI